MFAYFSPLHILAWGALTGFIFGFLLRKGRVVFFDVIVGQFLFKDFTVLKVMLSAIAVGSLGVYSLLYLGFIDALLVEELTLLANILGGVVFGIGMALFGYCPGTSIGAAASGNRDAIFGIIGGVFGAGLYAHLYPWFQKQILSRLTLGKETFPTWFHLSPWWFVGGFIVFVIVLFAIIEHFENNA